MLLPTGMVFKMLLSDCSPPTILNGHTRQLSKFKKDLGISTILHTAMLTMSSSEVLFHLNLQINAHHGKLVLSLFAQVY